MIRDGENAPASEWRVEAEDLARRVGGRLRAAQFFHTSRTMTIETVWPESEGATRAGSSEVRAGVVARFGWIG